MSKKAEPKDEVRPNATVTLTLTLAPSLSTGELTAFDERAREEGETVPERVARLIREDLSREVA